MVSFFQPFKLQALHCFCLLCSVSINNDKMQIMNLLENSTLKEQVMCKTQTDFQAVYSLWSASFIGCTTVKLLMQPAAAEKIHKNLSYKNQSSHKSILV
jgi:hypothetical protein